MDYNEFQKAWFKIISGPPVPYEKYHEAVRVWRTILNEMKRDWNISDLSSIEQVPEDKREVFLAMAALIYN